MSEKEWFAGRSVVPPPINHRPWWLDVLLGLGIFACTLFIIAGLAGCASPPQSFDGLCALQPVASQDGILVARVHCEQPQ